jgi:hypothetical protein
VAEYRNNLEHDGLEHDGRQTVTRSVSEATIHAVSLADASGYEVKVNDGFHRRRREDLMIDPRKDRECGH